MDNVKFENGRLAVQAVKGDIAVTVDLSIKEELYEDEVVESIITSLVENYSVEDIRKMSNKRLTKWLLETLCCSHASIMIRFIDRNEAYFKGYLSEDDDIDMFTDKIITCRGMKAPFNEGEPREFFDLLSNYIQYILKNI